MRQQQQHGGGRAWLVFVALLLQACSGRALEPGKDAEAIDGASTFPDDAAGGLDGGDGGASCPAPSSGIKVLGSAVQVLDHPPASGNLYTSLVSTGAEHLFFWRVFAGEGVFMRRIDASGQVVGDDVRLRAYENAFDVAWSDGAARVGAVWTTRGNAGVAQSIIFQTFDNLGNALTEPATIRSSTDINVDGSVVYGPRIAAAGNEFVVVWAELSRIFIAKVDRDGHLGGEPALVAESDNHPTLNVAAGTNGVLVGWTRGRPSPPPRVSPGMSMATRAFSSGLVPLGAATVLGQDPSFIGSHQLLFTDAGSVALWDFGLPPDGLVQVARLDDTGAQVGSNTMGAPVIGRYRYLSPTVWSRDHLVVLWDRTAPGDPGLTLSRFTATGERLGESLEIPTGQTPSRLYLTEREGSFAFIWSEEGDDRSYRVYFQRAGYCD